MKETILLSRFPPYRKAKDLLGSCCTEYLHSAINLVMLYRTLGYKVHRVYSSLGGKVRLLERIDPSGRTDGFEVRIEKT